MLRDNQFNDTVPLANLLRFVIPYVPELPQAMAMDMLRQAYIDFARRTKILDTEIVVPSQSGVREYVLAAPDGYQIYLVNRASDRRSDSVSHWNYAFRHSDPYGFDVIDNNGICLYTAPTQDNDYGICVSVVLIPDECASVIPKSISAPFGKMIGDHAVAAALFIPSKSWSDYRLARRYELEYQRKLLNAMAVARSGRKVGNSQMRPVRML